MVLSTKGMFTIHNEKNFNGKVLKKNKKSKLYYYFPNFVSYGRDLKKLLVSKHMDQ